MFALVRVHYMPICQSTPGQERISATFQQRKRAWRGARLDFRRHDFDFFQYPGPAERDLIIGDGR